MANMSQNLHYTLFLCKSYSKHASSVAIFLEVVHCSVDEYLRKILQYLHELHRKGPYFLSCDDKDAMTVVTQKKMKNYKRLKS